MNARLKKLAVVFGGVFVGLLIVYFAVVRPIVNRAEEKPETEPLETVAGEVIGINDRYMMYPQVERKGMQSILVENEYGTYEFYRDANGDFQIRGFEGTPFDLTVFSSLVTSTGYTLSKLKVVDNATDAELAEYGLDKPQASWTLTTLTGEKYKVFVGYDLLTGGGYYCMLDGRRSVYVLDTTLATTILSPIEKLLSPVLLAGIERTDYYLIDNFTVMRDEDVLCSITIIPHEEQNNPDALVENIMQYPTNYYPNEDVYQNILYTFMNFTGSYVVKLGASDEDFAQYGLAEPTHSIYFEYKGVQIMLFFSELQPSGIYYAVSSLFPNEIIAVERASVRYLEYDLIDWIARYPFQQWITAVSAVTVQGSGADVAFRLTHGKNADGNATLDVSASTGLEIPDSEVYNFRQFYKTLLSIDIQDYVPLTEAEIAALTAKEENCILTLTIANLAGEETVYRFYPYSGAGRRSLMTVNGRGEFYVQTDLIEKIASDANKVLARLDVNSYGKN